MPTHQKLIWIDFLKLTNYMLVYCRIIVALQ